MKIVYLTSFYSPDNASDFIHRLCEHFSPDSAVITTEPYATAFHGPNSKSFFEKVVDKLITIFIDPLWPNLYRANHFKLLRAIERERPDVVHIYWVHGHTIPFSVVRAVARKYKVFWTFLDMYSFTGNKTYDSDADGAGWQNGYIDLPWYSKTRRAWQVRYNVFKDLPIIVTVYSQWLKAMVLKSPIFKDHRIEFVALTINTDFFKPISAEEKSALKDRFKIPQDNVVLSFVSVSLNDKRKGYDSLRQALECLDKEILSKISVVVVGKDEGGLEPLPVNTIKMGVVSDKSLLRGIYNISDAYILGSKIEALSLSAVESISCGTPVIAFDAGGVPTVIQDGKNGFLVPTVEMMAKKIEAIATDPELRKQMSEEARIRGVKNFSDENQFRSLEKLYTD